MNKLIIPVLRFLPRYVWSYLTWILPWSKKLDKIPLEKRYKKVRSLIRYVNKILHLDIKVMGKENIQDTAACYVANHLGAADSLPYFEIFDKPICFLAKIEIEKMIAVGRIFKTAGGLFLDRDNLKQQLKIMLKVQDRLKENKCSWFIFPEGTRNKDQMAKILPFHAGTFRAPMKAGVPIVPVVNYGSFRFLTNKIKLKKYPTFIKFLKPIMPEDYAGKTTDEVASMVRSMIQKELTFVVRRLDHEELLKSKYKKYRFNQII